MRLRKEQLQIRKSYLRVISPISPIPHWQAGQMISILYISDPNYLIIIYKLLYSMKLVTSCRQLYVPFIDILYCQPDCGLTGSTRSFTYCFFLFGSSLSNGTYLPYPDMKKDTGSQIWAYLFFHRFIFECH